MELLILSGLCQGIEEEMLCEARKIEQKKKNTVLWAISLLHTPSREYNVAERDLLVVMSCYSLPLECVKCAEQNAMPLFVQVRSTPIEDW